MEEYSEDRIGTEECDFKTCFLSSALFPPINIFPQFLIPLAIWAENMYLTKQYFSLAFKEKLTESFQVHLNWSGLFKTLDLFLRISNY